MRRIKAAADMSTTSVKLMNFSKNLSRNILEFPPVLIFHAKTTSGIISNFARGEVILRSGQLVLPTRLKLLYNLT